MPDTSEVQLVNRIKSAARDCADRSRPYFTRFLTEAQIMLLKALRYPEGITAVFYGGNGNTEPIRQRLGLIPSFYLPCDDNDDEQRNSLYELFDIQAVTFDYRRCDKITHRDILGSLMGLGIERDTLGDIFVSEGKAAVFADSRIAQYIADSIVKIGRIGVNAHIGLDFELPRQQFELLDFSVASMRLDNIVKCIAGCGRSAAVDRYIKPGFVQLNGTVCDSVSHIVKEKDIISVRGKGKFVPEHIGEVGRKGNIHITIKKYV